MIGIGGRNIEISYGIVCAPENETYVGGLYNVTCIMRGSPQPRFTWERENLSETGESGSEAMLD